MSHFITMATDDKPEVDVFIKTGHSQIHPLSICSYYAALHTWAQQFRYGPAEE